MSSSLSDRLRRLLASPQGREARRKLRRAAEDPRTQRKIRELRARFRRR